MSIYNEALWFNKALTCQCYAPTRFQIQANQCVNGRLEVNHQYITVPVGAHHTGVTFGPQPGQGSWGHQIANAFPQVVGPAVAAFAIITFHSYTVLFILGTILALLGALLVQRIKGVR